MTSTEMSYGMMIPRSFLSNLNSFGETADGGNNTRNPLYITIEANYTTVEDLIDSIDFSSCALSSKRSRAK